MIDIKHISVVGTGGGGSMLLPGLAPAYDLDLYDGDDFEDHNITRQIFSETGRNKAVALAEFYDRGVKNVRGIGKMVTGGEDVSHTDLIFACVDSNQGRRAAYELAKEHQKPLIIIGNEEWEPMAFLFLPEFEGTNLDPFKRRGLGDLHEGRQRTCTGEVVVSEIPQLPQANHVSAGYGLTIMHGLLKFPHVNTYIAEAMATPYPIFKRVKDIPLES